MILAGFVLKGGDLKRVIEHTMREVELLLNENMLSLYKKHTPVPYSIEEEGQLPMAAEESTEWRKQ